MNPAPPHVLHGSGDEGFSIVDSEVDILELERALSVWIVGRFLCRKRRIKARVRDIMRLAFCFYNPHRNRGVAEAGLVEVEDEFFTEPSLSVVFWFVAHMLTLSFGYFSV